MATRKTETHKIGVGEAAYFVDLTDLENGRVSMVVRVPGHEPVPDHHTYQTTGQAIAASHAIADSQRLFDRKG